MTEGPVEACILAAVVEERRRLAGELHDCVGGTLSGVALGLSALQRTMKDDQSREKIADLVQAVHRGLHEIRTFSFSLQLPWCEPDKSFDAAVAQFSTGFGRRTGLKVSLDIAPPCGALEGNQALILLFVLQEALLNVHRHAGASSVHVSFHCDGQVATLSIQDDGRGMDLVDGAPPPGVGLASMRDHISGAGGVVRFESSRSGTTVTASLPFRSAKESVGAASGGRDAVDLKERSHSFMFVLSGPELRYEFANPTYLRMIGEQQVSGRRLLDVLPDLEPEFVAIIAKVRQTGEAFVGHGLRRVIRRNGETRTLYIDLTAQPLFGDHGAVEAVFLEGYDVTAKVEAEQHRKIVVQELEQHADNLLTVVRSIVSSGRRNRAKWRSWRSPRRGGRRRRALAPQCG
jgi:PAS domain-containing protein